MTVFAVTNAVLAEATAVAENVAGGVAESAAAGAGIADKWLKVPSQWPGQGDLLHWAETMGGGTAALLILVGIVYLLFGLYLFKQLIVLNAAAVGALAGMVIGDHFGAAAPGAVLGAFVAAVFTIPLMKWAVAVMGALLGAMIGGTVWRVANLDPAFAWSGATTGAVAFGMLCFILFRGCVMMYTSLQGSIMVVFGLLGLVFKYESIAPKLTESFELKPFLLPGVLLICTVAGVMYQQIQNAPRSAGPSVPPAPAPPPTGK